MKLHEGTKVPRWVLWASMFLNDDTWLYRSVCIAVGTFGGTLLYNALQSSLDHGLTLARITVSLVGLWCLFMAIVHMSASLWLRLQWKRVTGRRLQGKEEAKNRLRLMAQRILRGHGSQEEIDVLRNRFYDARDVAAVYHFCPPDLSIRSFEDRYKTRVTSR